MSPKQQRIAIAKSCEYHEINDQNTSCRKIGLHGWTFIPDYLNDLNAMHDAENVLTNEQWWLFVEFLTEIRGGGVALCISATAAQRAEAFLRTIGKWVES